MNKFLISCLLAFFFLISCDDSTTKIENRYQVATMDEIFQNKITNYADSLINLESKVYWHSGHRKIDELGAYSDSIYLKSKVKLKFENGDNYIANEKRKDQWRGDLFLSSQHLHGCWGGIVQKYCFKNYSLSNYNRTYVFQGRIQYRDWLNITDDILKDSVFINQSNDVVYWSQTFEFQIEEILDVY